MELRIPTGDVVLQGDLDSPERVGGVVLFAHGSGSGRHSPRNRFVAERLREVGLATLLIDLLTEEEERIDRVSAHLRFDLPLLSGRLAGLVDWLSRDEGTADARIGLFGASTGGGAALMAAADRPGKVAAVVSRGGRPDLAGTALPRVQAPTLLIVGERDTEVIRLNRAAFAQLTCPKRLEIVPGAGHLFEEPGRLEEVADLAADFFAEHLLSAEVTAGRRS